MLFRSQIKESMQQPLYPPKMHLAQTEGPSQNSQNLPQAYYPSTMSDRQKDAVHHHTGTTGWHHFTPQYPFPLPRRSHRRGCFKCQQRGAEADCMHCFKCGSDEHFMAGCRVKAQRPDRYAPLNEAGSLPRGGEWPTTS